MTAVSHPPADQRLREALERIEHWEMPATDKFWENADGSPSDRPMSYAAAYGSNGERDYIRNLARTALAAPVYDGWRPIGDAPKDGSYVLGFGPHATRTTYIDVKPCPFCGEQNALIPERCGTHYITCSICFADGPRSFNKSIAIEGWNTRLASDTEAEVEREACIRILEDMRPRNDPSDWNEFTVSHDAILRLAIEAINRRYPS